MRLDQPDLFERLAAERPAVLLYGMGNGADKIIAHLESKNIPVSGVFASDGFVRGQIFHGMRVQAFSEIKAAYDPLRTVILLSFGSARPEVLDSILGVAQAFPLLVPDMPVCGGPLFDRAYAAAHEEEIASARALFAERGLVETIQERSLLGEDEASAGAGRLELDGRD
jgi:hypothetical protein